MERISTSGCSPGRLPQSCDFRPEQDSPVGAPRQMRCQRYVGCVPAVKERENRNRDIGVALFAAALTDTSAHMYLHTPYVACRLHGTQEALHK